MRRQLAHVLADGLVGRIAAPGRRGPKAAAVERCAQLSRRTSRDIHQRGGQIQQGAHIGHRARSDVRPRHHQRNAGRTLEERHLEPGAPVAEHVAVIAGGDHHRVVGAAGLVQHREQLAQPPVEVARVGVVGVAGGAALLLGPPPGVGLDAGSDAHGVRIEFGGHRSRQVDPVVVVEVPPLGPCHIGVVGVDERHRQEERAVVGLAGQVVQAAAGGEADLVVVVDLVGGERLAGPRQAVHVVVPLADPLAGRIPVGRPREVGRVDVGGEATAEAVQLVGPDEVHLARQHRPVARQVQPVGDGGGCGTPLRRVVPGADLRCRPAGHHRVPRRSAQRRMAVRGIEPRTALRERVHRRRLHHGVAVGAGEMRRQLVRHHEQNVGRSHQSNSTPARTQRALARGQGQFRAC